MRDEQAPTDAVDPLDTSGVADEPSASDEITTTDGGDTKGALSTRTPTSEQEVAQTPVQAPSGLLAKVRHAIANPKGPPTQRVLIEIGWPGTRLTGANELTDADLLELLDWLQGKGYEMSSPFASTGGGLGA